MYNVLIAAAEDVSSPMQAGLEDAGYKVKHASTSATVSLLLMKETFDLVILDGLLPTEMEGELLREIKARSPQAKIILLTGYPPHVIRETGLEIAANDFLDKPYELPILLKKIKTLAKQDQQNELIADRLQGDSPGLRQIKEVISKVTNLNVRVLITGESGTGKGVIAKLIHQAGSWQNLPFVHLDCASLSENLIESELFGFERGAFTGAFKRQAGKFELAGPGIIFLDEIGALPLSLQVKLLTVLQEKTFYPLGSNTPLPMEAKIIAATNEDLEERVAAGSFRADLYYRLNVVRIEVPPLRERKEDITRLAKRLIRQSSQNLAKEIRHVADGFFEALARYDWPGNIRELENALESAVALSDSTTLQLEDLPQPIYQEICQPQPDSQASFFHRRLEEQEVASIIIGLNKFNGHREKTAAYLGISRRTLQYKLKKYNLLK